MPKSHKGYRFILCIIDEVTYYLIAVPIYHSRSEEIGHALIENVIPKYCIPDYIIMDQDSEFMSMLMNYLFKRLNIKIKMVALYNYQSLQAEYGIKSLSSIMTKQLPEQEQMWPKFLPLGTYKIVDPHNYLLMALGGKILRGLFEIETSNYKESHGNINSLVQLKQVLTLGMVI